MPEGRPPNRRIVGFALLASAGVMIALAVVAAAGVLPFLEQSRTIVAAAFGVAAVIDGLIGLRFLLSSST